MVAVAVHVVAVELAAVVVAVLVVADVALVADVVAVLSQLLLFHQVADVDLLTRLFHLAFGFQTELLSRFLTR